MKLAEAHHTCRNCGAAHGEIVMHCKVALASIRRVSKLSDATTYYHAAEIVRLHVDDAGNALCETCAKEAKQHARAAWAAVAKAAP